MTVNSVDPIDDTSDLELGDGLPVMHRVREPIEPLKMKRPTIIGPSIFNFKDIILGAIKSKAAIQINHIHELPKTITKLSNLETRNSMIQKSNKNVTARNYREAYLDSQERVKTLVYAYNLYGAKPNQVYGADAPSTGQNPALDGYYQ